MIAIRDILKNKEEQKKLEIARIEKAIDRRLININEIGPHGIRIKINQKMTPEIIDAVKELYESGGWKIDIEEETHECLDPAPGKPGRTETRIVFDNMLVRLNKPSEV